jgi:hypothetical protein
MRREETFMRTGAVRGAMFGVMVAVGAASPGAQQAHSHGTPASQESKAKPSGTQKPAAETQKPNRPKPENQPGAVSNAEKLAASHADHHEMAKLEGAGVLPEGWKHRFDLANMKLTDLRFLKHDASLHVTSGPPGIYYNPAITASGAYTVKGTFTQVGKGEHREGYGPFIGGTELEGEGQHYLYFLLRQDGRFLIKERVGVNTRGVMDWTTHKAIKSFDPDGRMTNDLAIVVAADSVQFLINGIEVGRKPRADVKTDGIVGLRVNHQLDVLVDNLTIEPAASRIR